MLTNLPENELNRSPKEADAEVEVDVATTALFVGDSGQLRLETRRVLVQLLLGPSLDVKRQSKLWPILVRDELILRSRLHDLFLELVVDHDQQVAFTRQVVSEEIDLPILLRKANLSFLESALLIFLRQRLTQAEVQGERAVVAASEMSEHLRVFEGDSNTDHAKFAKQIENAIEKAKKLNLVRQLSASLSASDKRFEVSPTLKLLFSAEEIQQLMKAYQQAASQTGQTADSKSDIKPMTSDDDEQAGQDGDEDQA